MHVRHACSGHPQAYIHTGTCIWSHCLGMWTHRNTCVHMHALCPVTGGSILGDGASAHVLCLYPDLPSDCRSSDQMLPRGSLSGCRTPLCSRLLPHALFRVGWKGQAQEAFWSALKTVLSPCPPLACSSIKHLF